MFADILKDLRAKSGLSQGQLAKAVGVSPGNVSDWELGKTKPGYSALSSLARHFEVTSDYLLELDSVPVKARIDLSSYKAEQGLTCDGTPLDEDEIDMIAMRRLLPKEHQQELLDLTYFKYERLVEKVPAAQVADEPPRIPFAASGWADITPEADSMIQEKLRQFEKRSLELKGKK